MPGRVRIARLLLALCAAALAACDLAEPPPPPQDEPLAEATDVEAPSDRSETVLLRVDHAWVRDGETPAEQAERRTQMDALRAKVAGGEGFDAAWTALELSGEFWHVAEGETYPADALPEPVQNLPLGDLSVVVPGDGGLHLFRILGRDEP